MGWFSKFLLASVTAFSAFATCQPVSAQSITVVTGRGELTRAGYKYSIGPGTVLRQWDVVKALGTLQINGPFGAYLITTRGQVWLTYVALKKCTTRGIAIDNVVSFFSPFSASGRPFTCPSSLFRAIDMRTLTNYRIKSNASFETVECTGARRCAPTTILTVAAGEVTASNAGVDVVVPAGYGNRTREGEPPGAPFKIDYALSFKETAAARTPWGERRRGQMSPGNTALIGDLELLPDKDGLITYDVRFPVVGNQWVIEIKSGDRRRSYPLPLPHRKI